MKKLLLTLLLIPAFCYSQEVSKRVTYDNENVVSEELSIGNWTHYYSNGQLSGTWYRNDSVMYNYDSNGELLCKKVTCNDSVFLYDAVGHEWEISLKEVSSKLSPIANLFNPYDPEIITGHYVDCNNGEVYSNDLYCCTGYIAVKGGIKYQLSYKHQIAWFDDEQNYISGSNSSDKNTIQLAPENAVYLRCTIIKDEIDIFEVIKL